MYKDIQEQFNKVLIYSQNEDNPQTDKLFEQWHAAKQMYIRKFGGLIYEVPMPVAFRLGEKERLSRAKAFVEMVDNSYCNYELARFISANIDGFYENKTVVDYYNPIDGSTIQAGAKLVRAFKYFETEAVTLAHLQTQASMLIQEDKVEGTLCFSVHPLDYLSISENNYNWRSCHALDGEYRCGNLSYMCDETTVVCYLKGKDDEKLPRFPADVPWNSKKWRVLLTYSDAHQIIFAGRQYPFFSEGALDIIFPYFCFATHSEPYVWTDWHDDFINSFDFKNGRDCIALPRHYPIGENIYKLTDLIVDQTSGKHNEVLHFNDLIRSSCYLPYYKWNKYSWRAQNCAKIEVGGAPYCIHCGEQEIAYTDSMYCDACELEFGSSENEQFARCGCCESRFEADEGMWTDDGSFICPACQENECQVCEQCGTYVFKDRAIFCAEIDGFLCPACKEDM